MGVNVTNFGPGTEPGVLRRWAQTVEGARDGSRGYTSPSGATMTEEVTEADLPHLRRCVELATEAVEAGDFPFGSVLVAEDGTVLAEDRNRGGHHRGPDAPPRVRAGAVGGDEHDSARASRSDGLYLR